MSDAKENSTSASVQSIEIGMRLLQPFTRSGEPQMISRLAEAAGMKTSKAHRYLVGLMRSGMVAKDQGTGLYKLGPLAISLGLSALREIDLVQIGSDALERLSARTSENLYLSVWGNRGPVIIRVIEGRQGITVAARAGHVLPILTTAIGRTFASSLPWDRVSGLIREEAEQNRKRGAPREISDMRTIKAMLAAVAGQDFIRIVGSRESGLGLPGFDSVTAPIRKNNEQVAATLSISGPSGEFDSSDKSEIVKALVEEAKLCSAYLGSRPSGTANELSTDTVRRPRKASSLAQKTSPRR